MSEENKKKLKEYQKNYREAKNYMLHKCKCASKSVLQVYIFFILLLILKDKMVFQ